MQLFLLYYCCLSNFFVHLRPNVYFCKVRVAKKEADELKKRENIIRKINFKNKTL